MPVYANWQDAYTQLSKTVCDILVSSFLEWKECLILGTIKTWVKSIQSCCYWYSWYSNTWYTHSECLAHSFLSFIFFILNLDWINRKREKKNKQTDKIDFSFKVNRVSDDRSHTIYSLSFLIIRKGNVWPCDRILTGIHSRIQIDNIQQTIGKWCYLIGSYVLRLFIKITLFLSNDNNNSRIWRDLSY
jgi:hypothetical protein